MSQEELDPLSIEQIDSLVENTFRDVQSSASMMMEQDPSAFMLKMQKAFDVYSLSFEEVLSGMANTNTDPQQGVLRKLFHGLKYQLFYMFDFTIQQVTAYSEMQTHMQEQLKAAKSESSEVTPYDIINEQIKREMQPILPGRRQISIESPTKNNSLSTITEVFSSQQSKRKRSDEEPRNSKNTTIISNFTINNKSVSSPPDTAKHIQMNDTFNEKHLDNELDKYNKEYVKTQLEIDRVLYKSKSLLETKKSMTSNQLEKALEDIEKTKHKIKKIEKEFSPEKKTVKISDFHIYPQTTINLEEVEVEDEESEVDMRDVLQDRGVIRFGNKPKTADKEIATEGPTVDELEKEVAYLKEEMKTRLEKKDQSIENLNKDITRANNEAARMKKFFLGREDKLNIDLRNKESDLKNCRFELETLQKKLEDLLRYHGGSVDQADRKKGALQKYIKKLEEEVECFRGMLEKLQKQVLVKHHGLRPEDLENDDDEDPETRLKKLFANSKTILGDNYKSVEYFELYSHTLNRERSKLYNEIKVRDEAILSREIPDDPEPESSLQELPEQKVVDRSSTDNAKSSVVDMSHIHGILSNVSPSSNSNANQKFKNLPKIQQKLMRQAEVYEKRGTNSDGKKKNNYYVDKINPRPGVPLLKLQDMGNAYGKRLNFRDKQRVYPGQIVGNVQGNPTFIPNSHARPQEAKNAIKDILNEKLAEKLIAFKQAHPNVDLQNSSPMMDSMERAAFSEIDINEKSLPTEEVERNHTAHGARYMKSISNDTPGSLLNLNTMAGTEPTYRSHSQNLPTITVNTRNNSPTKGFNENLNPANSSSNHLQVSSTSKKGSYSQNPSPVPQRPGQGMGHSQSQKTLAAPQDPYTITMGSNLTNLSHTEKSNLGSNPGTPKNTRPAAPIINFEPQFGGGAERNALPLFQFTPSLGRKKNIGENLNFNSPTAFQQNGFGSLSSRSANNTQMRTSPRNFKNKLSLDASNFNQQNTQIYMQTLGSQSTRMQTVEEEILVNEKRTNLEELVDITQSAKEILQKEEDFTFLAKTKEDAQMVKLYKAVLKKSQYDPAVAQFLAKVKEEDHESDTPTVKKLNFDHFKKYFEKVSDQHKTCGPNCIHLLRFYSRVGYNAAWSKRKALEMKIAEVRTEVLGNKAVNLHELQARGSFVGHAIHKKAIWP